MTAASSEAPAGLSFIATCDLAAQVRGRAVPASEHAAAVRRGVGWVPADLAINGFGDIAEDNIFGSVGDLRLLPDTATAIDLPAAAGGTARLYLADQVTTDGEPWACCPRAALKGALDRLRAETGLEVVASFEHEFVIDGLPDSAPFSLQRFRDVDAFGSELVGLLGANGLEPETWLPEYAPGQFEVTMRPSSGLAAADRAVLLREIVRDTARRHGHTTTFAPLLHPDGVGNGVHVHLSFVDGSGRPVLNDADLPGGLSSWGARFAGGILRHSEALVALTAPSPVSLLRLKPHRWSAAGAFVAERNREALVRICPTSTIGDGDPARQLNLEYRACDATANPWIVLAALIHAGINGLDRPEPRIWPESVTEGQLESVPALPSSLADALIALEQDAELLKHLPTDLVRTHLDVKRSELAAVAGMDPAEACRMVCDAY